MGQEGDYAFGRKSGTERQRPGVLVCGSWVWKSTVTGGLQSLRRVGVRWRRKGTRLEGAAEEESNV